MNKILVLYKSKYGATKQYVKMLKEAIPCDTCEIDHYSFSEAMSYDFIIVAGGIYASGIAGLKTLRKNLNYLNQASIVIIAVGASPFDKKAFQELTAYNLKNMPVQYPVFYARGAYDEKNMDFKDRTLCRLLKKSLSKKDPATFEPWMKALFEAGQESCNWVDFQYLIPLLDYLKRPSV